MNLPGAKERPARMADKLTAISESSQKPQEALNLLVTEKRY
jgi:hypothetical protein